ncbi:MAG: IS3 family transposase [Thermoleophilia bacterium]|nr:IS3 family transposase [Thermoleophilia bacterium]
MTRFRFIAEEAAQFPVSLLCRVMGVTRGGFYAWRKRPPSARARADAELSQRIGRIHDAVAGIYGAPRIHAELRLGHGIRVGKKRVARLMAERGIFGAGRRGGPRTTSRDPARASAPDLVDRDFARAEPNRLWVCDIKYVQTGQGFLFLAVVQDVFSRRIVGWSMRDDLRAELVLDALGMAVAQRRADVGLIAHSDHGSQPGFKGSSQHHPCRGERRSSGAPPFEAGRRAPDKRRAAGLDGPGGPGGRWCCRLPDGSSPGQRAQARG